MIEPQYYWQMLKHLGGPIIDIPEDEVEDRLEAIIRYLSTLESEESKP